ncbi:MAG: VWA domain-containing protein [Deltaproteobacteria bacterium]
MATTYRYRKWSGQGSEFALEPEKLFEKFSNFLMEGWTPDEALEWMIKQGFHGDGVQFMGIDELRSQVSKQKEAIAQKYTLRESLSEIKNDINSIVERELAALGQKLPPVSPEYQKRRNSLKNLSDKVSPAIEALSDYDFLDDDARAMFESIKRRLDDVKKVENFASRNMERFKGKTPLTFDETLSIIDKFQQMEKLEFGLASGNFDKVNLDDLKEFLTEKGIGSFAVLRDLKSNLEQSGFIKIQGQHAKLSPKGIRKIGQLALRDIFSSLKKDQFGGHETSKRGFGALKPEDTKEYEFGDPFNLNLIGTLKNSLVRQTRGAGGIKLAPEDFEVYEMEYYTQSTTVLLLDLSWSMSFQGRFPAAKRVALALDHLIKTQFLRDELYIVGFSTRAKTLTTEQLAAITWDSNDPFTNIQEALVLASRLLSRHKNRNRQIVLITDGQPTAYFLDGYLQVELPMFFGGLSPRATFETLKEVKRVTKMGITINTFMLDDSASLRRFVEEMTRINRGRAFFTTPSHLGKYLLVDYLKRKKKQI